MSDQKDIAFDESLTFTSEIVAAYVSHNSIHASDLPGLVGSVHAAIKALSQSEPEVIPATPRPAVPINKSITPDYLVCLEDGKKFKSLRRHLSTRFQLTPDQYRVKWGLRSDYPMTAPNYAAVRSALAKGNGLGRKPAETKTPGKRKRAAPGTATK